MSTKTATLLGLRIPVADTEDSFYLPLDESCGLCDGTGGPTPGCDGCRGIGRVPNSNGQVMLELVYRYADFSDTTP